MTSTYPLSGADREIQERARAFVDEQLIPWEQHAEEHAGQIPEDVREKHHAAAIELGLAMVNGSTTPGNSTSWRTGRMIIVSGGTGGCSATWGFTLDASASVASDMSRTPQVRGQRKQRLFSGPWPLIPHPYHSSGLVVCWVLVELV